MPALSPRESRLLAILLLVAVLALVDLAVVMPLQAGFAARAQQRAALLARYAVNDRLIGAIPRLARAAAQQNRRLSGYILTAPDAATAADALRDRLQAATTAVGGDVRGGEDIAQPPGASGPADKAVTRVTLRVPGAQLAQFLALVENAPPFVTINAMAVRADDTIVAGQAAPLEVTLDAAVAFRPATPR